LGRPNILGRTGARLGRPAIFSLNRVVHLLSVHGDGLGRFDAQPYFITADVHDRHHDIVADHDAFVSVSGKDEHVVLKVIDVSG
jgi:hypothetical protein